LEARLAPFLPLLPLESRWKLLSIMRPLLSKPCVFALFSLSALFCLVALGASPLAAQQGTSAQFPSTLLAGLQWRDVGPMRGGRSYAVAGNPGEPNTFYTGSVGGGVWKTVNAGRTWFPVSDQGIPIGSIGAIAVAPSNPAIVYVGTGEPDIRSQHSYGIGMYKSIDSGKSWIHIGLADSAHIGRIAVDPRDPNRLYVAVLGHAYDANAQRGLFRSVDGGAHWKKILANATHPDDVGAIDVTLDPSDPHTIYASLWATRRPPWAVYAPSYMPGSGLYKSTDGGDTWKQLTGGLPTDDFVGKIGVAVAPSDSNRVWAVVDDPGVPSAPGLVRGGAAPARNPTAKGGIYRSDDAGATWHLVNSETRLWGRGWYFGQITVDPRNPDVAYDINTATYRTADAGKTWLPVKGAPGGDDYHQLWINPADPRRMVLSGDQGTVVSVDNAATWTTWYNQPTAEIYHIAADNRFPYWLYGAQQDSGAVAVSTWSRMGLLTFRNWEPTCLAGESDTVLPDPKDGNILYGSGAGRCNQALNLPASLGGTLPPPDPANPNRKTWTLPQVFSEADEALYYANQFVFRSRDRGRTWQTISPDLTRLHPAIPANLDSVTAHDIDQPMSDRFGVVYTLAPSPLRASTVWAGTDDGLIQLTRDDGKTWQNVTPAAMSTWSKVTQLEAGHFEPGTAYASVDRHRLGDPKPYIYATHDAGRTWKLIANGIPTGAYVNSVKEDPRCKGLLYAATELRVYVSFDDGSHWEALQNNMPVTSVRDILVHGDDLAIATHGRGFWVMDQMSPLREIASHGTEIASSPAHLFTPGPAYAIRTGGENGTPLPKEEPQELNPPAGVLAYYWLQASAQGPLKLELVDSKGAVIVCAASDDPVHAADTEAINVQAVWREPALPPSASAGMHRFALNLPQHPFEDDSAGTAGPASGDACSSGLQSQASNLAPKVPQLDDPSGEMPSVLAPGRYTLRLTVDGKTFNQPATVKPDPRGEPVDHANPGIANHS
jgi:photosystem II stability/assembly factor-like uncharacterized protein